MSAMIPYSWRSRTESILIFGAGKQALWHARLALALRGQDIKTITIVNRSESRAAELVRTLKDDNASYWRSACQFGFLESNKSSSQAQLKEHLSTADVIFCTVPSREPLFPLESLQLENRGRYPIICAVGSWQPDMIEVDPSILHHVTRTEGLNQTGGSTGTVIVDDDQYALVHAGEMVQGGLSKEQILGIGQVLNWKRDGTHLATESKRKLDSWLANDLIVYKSIGVSVTDLAAGNAILALAAEKGLGASIQDF